MTHTSASAVCRIIDAVGMNITDIFLGAVRLNLSTLDSISIIARSADALILVQSLVELAVSERMTTVDDVARD